MEMRKLILYFALGLILFALWSAWKNDYGPKPVVSKQATKNSVVVNNETTTPNSAPVDTANVTSTAVPKDRIVTVKTDVLNIKIDTLNGNIIGASLLKYPVDVKHPNIPIEILSNQSSKLEVATSGLTGIFNHKPILYSTTRKNYYLSNDEKTLTVNLRAKNEHGVSVIKSFIFTKGSYAIGINYNINNRSNKNLTGSSFTQIEQLEPKAASGFFHLHTYTGAAISSPKDPYQKISYKDMDKKDLSEIIQGGWVAVQQRYFLTALIPNQDLKHHYYSKTSDQQIYTIGLNSPINIDAGKSANFTSTVYIGPEIAENLAPLAHGLNLTIDYGWLWVISVAIFWLMQHIYNFVGNWGWTIILVTVLIKLVFYKFSETSYKSMAKMRVLAPKMKELKERYGDDRQKMSQATMELYKKEKVNPLGGCLPIVIQIPVFIALYYVLLEAVQLRQAPFILWIHDLSAADPYYILPILMGVSMFVQQKLNPPPPDPTQAKMMMFLPVVFTVLFLAFPAGLVLYWLVNNLLSILQQWHIMRRYEAEKKSGRARK